MTAARKPTPAATPLRMSVVQEARAEFYDRALDQMSESLELLRALGLHSSTLLSYLGALAVVKVNFDDGRGWDFSDYGKPAIVAEVFDRDCETAIDLVAWPVGEPERFQTFAGIGEGFGIEQVTAPAAAFGGQPLVVHGTPFNWFRAGCVGAVILNELTAPAWLSESRRSLAASTVPHARELARLLHGFFPPSRILAPRGADRS